jgi:hypothetical protein
VYFVVFEKRRADALTVTLNSFDVPVGHRCGVGVKIYRA